MGKVLFPKLIGDLHIMNHLMLMSSDKGIRIQNGQMKHNKYDWTKISFIGSKIAIGITSVMDTEHYWNIETHLQEGSGEGH